MKEKMFRVVLKESKTSVYELPLEANSNEDAEDQFSCLSPEEREQFVVEDNQDTNWECHAECQESYRVGEALVEKGYKYTVVAIDGSNHTLKPEDPSVLPFTIDFGSLNARFEREE